MLKSFTRHLNDTVFRGPDMEGGSGDTEIIDNGGGSDGGSDDHLPGGDGAGEAGEDTPQKTLSVREQLKKSIAEASEDDKNKTPKRGKDGRFGDRAPKGQEAAPPAEEIKPAPAAPAVPAPASLPAEAKAEWEKTPPAVQAAFIKREQDMNAGVEQLKQRYNLIDQALAPHTDALRQMNATPGDAVNRMFLWFKALAGNPQAAFPELAKSMGIDWKRLSTPQVQGQQAAPVPGAEGGAASAPEIPDAVKQYIGGLEQKLNQYGQALNQVAGRFGSVEQNINTQNEARTRENLNLWSTGKKHFEAVRQDMAKMIETGVVPLKDGQVDLDTAYERAIYFNPEVRALVLAEQQQANLEAQQQTEKAATTVAQQQVTRARKAAGGSLPASSTPGAPNGAGKNAKPGQKMSVRDSLRAAIAQVRDQ
jgi:hypothetical protein